MREAELVRRVYDALNRRDLAEIERLVDPAVVVKTTVETVHGFPGIADWVCRLDEIFEGYRVTVDDIAEVGDRLVAITRQEARGTGSGIETSHRISHVWTVRDGRVVSIEAFTDHEEAALAAARAPGRRPSS